MTDEIEQYTPGLGFRPSPPDPNDRLFPITRFVGAPALPAKRLRRVQVPPNDQDGHNWCVGYSFATTKRIAELIEQKRTVVFDGEWGYYQCKAAEGEPKGSPHAEDGTNPRLMLQIAKAKGMKELGADRYWPIAGYSRLWSGNDLKTAIVALDSAWTALRWPGNWMRVSGNELPAPGAVIGGHMVNLVAYDDTRPTKLGRGAYLLENNYGSAWGIGGVCWLPYPYLAQLFIESWKSIDRVDTPEEAVSVKVRTSEIKGRWAANAGVSVLAIKYDPDADREASRRTVVAPAGGLSGTVDQKLVIERTPPGPPRGVFVRASDGSFSGEWVAVRAGVVVTQLPIADLIKEALKAKAAAVLATPLENAPAKLKEGLG